MTWGAKNGPVGWNGLSSQLGAEGCLDPFFKNEKGRFSSFSMKRLSLGSFMFCGLLEFVNFCPHFYLKFIFWPLIKRTANTQNAQLCILSISYSCSMSLAIFINVFLSLSFFQASEKCQPLSSGVGPLLEKFYASPCS